MKKTTITIATMTLLLTLVVTASGQDRRRRAPQQVGNPFGLGGTVTAGAKNHKPMHPGDTGTHEVGHVKGNRRPIPKEQEKRPNLGVTPAGIAGATEVASKDLRKQSNKRRKTQNLLP